MAALSTPTLWLKMLSWGVVALGLGLHSALAVAQRPAQEVRAAEATTGPAWRALTPAQRQSLQPIRGEWDQMDAARKVKWIQLADRLPQMPPAERERVQTRMREWARMSPEQRGQARLNYRQAQRTTAQDRRERWEAYQSLSPEQRKAYANQGTAPRQSPPNAAQGSQNKSTLVPLSVPGSRQRAIEPSVTQAAPGATTNLVNKRPNPPIYQQPGLPKVATDEILVDPKTLQPRRGAQAAGARAPAPPPPRSAPPSRP